MARKKLSIVIPVYNEEATLRELLDTVAETVLPVDREILIVNDGSVDCSLEIAEAWRDARANEALEVTLISQENRGKGSAVRAGIKASTGDVVIIQDADLEYDPNDYVACIEPILAGEVEVVYGSRERFAANHMHSSWAFYLGGMLVSSWFSLLYLTRLTDEPTCYKTFDGELIRTLLFEGDGFEWEPGITAKLLRLGFRIHEVPISYRPRNADEGKKIRASDGFRALWEALRWRVKSIDGERAKLRNRR
jgi:glycosyltransferase involved in cell wall biosynthesis